ncbi:MAG: hypothetical protein R6V01_07545 [Thermoplasmatota archaeon]
MNIEILETVGDDPLGELMDVDQFYGWSRRIAVLESIFRPRKRSKVIYLPLMIFLLLFLGCAGVLVYLLMF